MATWSLGSLDKKRQRNEIIRGLLFVADNRGECPPNTTLRNFMVNNLEAHLSSHTYYYQSNSLPGVENRMRADVDTLRQQMRDLFKEATKESQERRKELKQDTDDFFFAHGSKLFSSEALAKHGYDKATISSADLPAFVEKTSMEKTPLEKKKKSVSATNSNLHTHLGQKTHAWRSYHIMIQDIDAHSASREEPGHKYGTPKARDSALRQTIQVFKLGHRVGDDLSRRYTSKDLSNSLKHAWRDRQKPESQGKSFWTADIDDWDTTYISWLQEASKRLLSREGLPKYDPETVAALTAGGKPDQRLIQSDHSGKDDEDAISETTPGMTLFSLNEELNEQIAVPGTRALRMQTPLTTADDPSTSNPDTSLSGDDDQTPFGTPPSWSRVSKPVESAPTNGHKRKRAQESSSKAQKRMQSVASAAADVSTTSDPSAQITFTIERSDQALHQDDSAREPQPVRELGRFNVDKTKCDLTKVGESISSATSLLLAKIGCFDRSQKTPLAQPPSSALKSLYARCWGNDWPERVRQLNLRGLLPVLEVTNSLVSAFVFDHVVNREVLEICSFEQKLLESGACGQMALSLLNAFEKDGSSFARQCYDLILRDEDHSLQEKLKSDAEVMSKELWVTLLPHLEALATCAKSFMQETEFDATAWHIEFQPAIIMAIEQALHLRLKLLSLDIEHAFLWHATYEPIKPESMKANNFTLSEPAPQGRVAFTEFPGLKVTAADNGAEEDYFFKALVKVVLK